MCLVPGLGVIISYDEAEDLDLLSVIGTSAPGGRPGKNDVAGAVVVLGFEGGSWFVWCGLEVHLLVESVL